MSSGWDGIKATAVVSIIQLVVFYGLYECWRGQDSKKNIYFARLPTMSHRTPEPPGKGLFSWLRRIRGLDDAEVLKDVGLDTYVFLRFLRLGVLVTVPAAVLGCVLLIPVYVTVPGVSGKNFNDLTGGVVPKGDARLWAPWCYFNVFALYVLYLMWNEAKHFLPLRKAFLAKGDVDTPEAFMYTALVENIPTNARSSHALLGLVNSKANGQAVSASLCLHTEKLDKLIAERQADIIKIENATAKKTFKPEKGEPTNKIGKPLCFGQKVETIPHYEGELARLNDEIDEEYRSIMAASQRMDNASPEFLDRSAKAKSSSSMMPFSVNKEESKTDEDVSSMSEEQMALKWKALASATGYVKFASLQAKQEAISTKWEGGMKVLAAPEPHDLIWKNVCVTTSQQKMKRVPCNALWLLGILFWVVPITFIASLSNLDSLQQKLPFLKPIISALPSFVYGLLSGYLPVILLLVFMMLIPIVIFAAGVGIIRYKATSQADSYTFVWHYGFQVANLFLLLIGGSLINQLDAIISDPTSLANLLATAIPTQAQYFVALAITLTCTGLMLELSQLVAFIVKNVIMKKLVKPESQSQRSLDASLVPAPLKWGWIYPTIIFQFLIALVYAPITPIMLLFSACYFLVAESVLRNNALFIYAQQNEGGGATYYVLYPILMSSLYIAEFIFLAWLGLKSMPSATPLLIVLIIVTVVADVMMRRKFLGPSRTLTAEEAQRADKTHLTADKDEAAKEGNAPLTTVDLTPPALMYKQPGLVKETWETEPRPYRGQPTLV